MVSGWRGPGVESCAYEAQIIGTTIHLQAGTPALERETLMALLADEDIQARLAERSGWVCEGGALVKKFELDDFMAVVNLVNAVAPRAEAADHHPDMFINYRRITFTLSTHSEGGVTEKDFALLDEIEQLAGA